MAETRFLKPKRHIQEKVRPGGPAPQEAILAALNGAEDLIGQYQGWAVDDLERLWQTFLDSSADGSPSPEQIKHLFNLAHETRGQGGTFGYPLISIIGDSLCKYLEGRDALSTTHLEILKVHILAMKATFRQKLQGRQRLIAAELPGLLQALRDRADR